MIALSMVPGIGPRRIQTILDAKGETGDIFDSLFLGGHQILQKQSQLMDSIRSVRESKEYEDELLYMDKEQIKALCLLDEGYPDSLKEIYDPPSVLYYKGEFLPEDANAIAIVGSRKCSSYGLEIAKKLASDLAERGITVVSGMARGIDSAAHTAAIRSGGRTIAVMGSGFKKIYPPEADSLADDISRKGAVITEYTSKTLPNKGNFPRRNRIISGISKGVIVVEAGEKSGALITVDFALEQGKEVFAVPGSINHRTSYGTNKLIQSGAKLVSCVQDVLDEININNKVWDLDVTNKHTIK